MGFNSAVDIANRALQHCGVPPSNRIAALTDNSKNAKECALVYDKVRESELREKDWRYSISDQASNTGNTPTSGEPWESYFGPLTVTSYDSTIGYFSGEIVYDGSNNVWFSL